jgi:two-component system NtrC family sensor kinase
MIQESGTTILVVDDNEALRYAIVRALRSGGYQVVEAETGAAALKLAAQAPDLITLDIRLPDIDGYEVCRRLRARPDTNHIPILHISASFVAPEHKVKALEGGADAYLAEPITKDELLATVKALLRMKRAESEARRREQELRFLADSIPHMVWIADTNGNAVYFNDRWFEFTGLKREESLSAGWLQVIHRDDLAEVTDLWRKSLRAESPFQTEARYRTGNGDYRWVSMRAVLMQQSKEYPGRWFGTSTDIQEEKRKEELFHRTERMALAGRLAASIAHEINNPLEAITNIFYILEGNTAIDEKTMSLVRMGSEELSRVSHIVRQSLSYYRNAEEPAAVKLSELLEETMRILGHHVTARRIRPERQYQSDARVTVVAGEIRQVFSNLILNAIEAMQDNGRLVLRVHESRDWHNGGRPGVRVAIGDDGPGISAKDRAHIFDAFFTTKSEKGTGLGLWVSSDIVRKHGGHIRVRSCTTPGRSGTVFSVFFPHH